MVMSPFGHNVVDKMYLKKAVSIQPKRMNPNVCPLNFPVAPSPGPDFHMYTTKNY